MASAMSATEPLVAKKTATGTSADRPTFFPLRRRRGKTFLPDSLCQPGCSRAIDREKARSPWAYPRRHPSEHFIAKHIVMEQGHSCVAADDREEAVSADTMHGEHGLPENKVARHESRHRPDEQMKGLTQEKGRC